MKSTKWSQRNVWATVCALELGIIDDVILPVENLPIKSSVTESTSVTLESNQNDITIIQHDHDYGFPVPSNFHEISSSRENLASINTSTKSSEENYENSQKMETIKDVTRIPRKRRINRKKKSYTSMIMKRGRFEIEKSKNLESTKENFNKTHLRRELVSKRVNVPCASIGKNLSENVEKSRQNRTEEENISMKNVGKKDYVDTDIEGSHARIVMANITKNDCKVSNVDEKSSTSKIITRARLEIAKSTNLESTKENCDITRPRRKFVEKRVNESHAIMKKNPSKNLKKTEKAIFRTKQAKNAMKATAGNDKENSGIDKSLLVKIVNENGTKNDCEDSAMGEKNEIISNVTERIELKIGESENLESVIENHDITQRSQECLSPSVNEPSASIKKKPKRNSKKSRRFISRRKGIKIRTKNIAKNDYEDSEIDESLLVDPSRDLPRLITDTVFPDINLTSPEFNKNLDLNFETDERLSSTFESLERDMLEKSKKKIAKISKKSSGKSIKLSQIETRGKIQKKLRFVRNSTKKNPKSLTKVRRSADDIIIENQIMASRNHEYNKNDQNTIIDNANGRTTRQSVRKLLEKGESTGGATVEIDSIISSVKNIPTKVNEKNRQFPIGTLVWANCQGWWPALVIDGADVGKYSSPGTIWVCWVGDNRISNLRKNTEVTPFSERFADLVKFLKVIESGNCKSGVKRPKSTRYKIYIDTLNLINEQIFGNKSWKKPHYIWAEKNIMSLKNLDRLIFYPFPSEMQARLDELKRSNEESEESSVKKNVSSWSNSKRFTDQENDEIQDSRKLSLSSQQFGTIAWTKFENEPWWPGIIVDYRDTDLKQPNFGKQMICRYGDFDLSEIDSGSILKFDLDSERFIDYDKNKQHDYRRAIIEAAQDFCSRHGYQTVNWTISEIRDWFEKYHKFGIDSNSLPGISIDSEKLLRYPARISEALKKHNGNYIVELEREESIRKSNHLTRAILEKRKINDICLMCLKTIATANNSIDHPFFCCKLCSECSIKYVPTIFACGDDGKGSFCTVCAGSDTLLICDEITCTRVYCTPCVKYIIARETFDDIFRTDPWRCFFCDEYSKNSMARGALEIRNDWKERVSKLIRSNFHFVPTRTENFQNEKKKIRVLSLFDGISAGYVALKRLGIKIEAYFSSEIEPNAELISSANFGGKITRLGDVREITKKKLQEIGPIDFLIGGSPCNDLSVANPDRLGLNNPKGSGILFFEYTRIKDILENQNKDANRLFFWLFENVASMPEQCKIQIDRFLGRKPRNINSANCSPQHRERLYWGNLPPVSFPVSSQDVQDILAPNRRSLVTKTRTVTTSRHSLMQGTKKIGRQKPILMNETSEGLQIHEVEEIFGFPKHYTDVGDLCVTKRHKLIGKSWSVQTIVELFRPLRHFFEHEMDD